MTETDSERPQWHNISIKAAPKIGNIYWCQFNEPELVQLPEMWKMRPVVIVSYRDPLIKGSSLVLPFTTGEQPDNKWTYEVPGYITNIIGSGRSWIICNHLVTVSNSRLSQIKNKVLRLEEYDKNKVIELMLKWLPSN